MFTVYKITRNRRKPNKTPATKGLHFLAIHYTGGGGECRLFQHEIIKEKAFQNKAFPKIDPIRLSSQSGKASSPFGAPFFPFAVPEGQASPTQGECACPRFHLQAFSSVAATPRPCQPYYTNSLLTPEPHRQYLPWPKHPPFLPTTTTRPGVGSNYLYSAATALPSHRSNHTPYSPARSILGAYCGPLHSCSPVSRILSDADHRPFPPIPAAIRLLFRPLSRSSI
jgi:hypothetical protein